MKNWKILFAFLTVVLVGCQQTEEVKTPVQSQVQTEQETAVQKDGLYGKPFSTGPTAGPETMSGPTTPPPETSAQAVTTKENIRLTLPRKVE